jgi:hypothetical protein
VAASLRTVPYANCLVSITFDLSDSDSSRYCGDADSRKQAQLRFAAALKQLVAGSYLAGVCRRVCVCVRVRACLCVSVWVCAGVAHCHHCCCPNYAGSEEMEAVVQQIMHREEVLSRVSIALQPRETAAFYEVDDDEDGN